MKCTSATPSGYIIKNLHSPLEYVSAFDIGYDGFDANGVQFDCRPVIFLHQCYALQALNAIPPEYRSGFTILPVGHPWA